MLGDVLRKLALIKDRLFIHILPNPYNDPQGKCHDYALCVYSEDLWLRDEITNSKMHKREVVDHRFDPRSIRLHRPWSLLLNARTGVSTSG